MKLFSANLRAERARKHYTQEQLAEMTGVSVEYISRVENEKICPTILTIANMAIALEINLDTLLPLK